eukprot:510955-Hanusia_phi.AAC.3
MSAESGASTSSCHTSAQGRTYCIAGDDRYDLWVLSLGDVTVFGNQACRRAAGTAKFTDRLSLTKGLESLSSSTVPRVSATFKSLLY